MTTYGQFCPVAKAMEVLDERWTLLVVREMLAGSSRFNEVRRGVPKMSPALLSKRLRTLQRAGVVERDVSDGEIRYRLTPSGTELAGVVQALGLWGLRWVPEMGQEDLDPHLLFWDMQRTVPVAAWPATRTVLAFQLTDVDPRASRWWLVVGEDHVDVCDADPGHEIAATVVSGLRAMVKVWRGDLGWDAALANGSVRIVGPESVRRAVPVWLGRSRIAQLAEMTAG